MQIGMRAITNSSRNLASGQSEPDTFKNILCDNIGTAPRLITAVALDRLGAHYGWC